MEERQYQQDHITKIVEEVSLKRCIVAQLPTGGGKTVEFALICQRYIKNTGKNVLILVHREELMYQAQRTIREILGVNACLITKESNRYFNASVYIGMIDSTVRRLNIFNNVGLVIVDECHVANFNKIHALFLEELIIGFTATPIAASKREPLNKYYSAIVCGPQIKELIALRHLSQNITRIPKDVIDSTKLAIDKFKGDYDERQMAMEYKVPKHIMNTIKAYHKFCGNQKTIVFNVNIEHSKKVTQAFQLSGFNCKHLDSTSTDRKEILQWFKETPDAILCNVMIATVGFDEPTIRNVILNFSTVSLVKYIQCSGRGSRWLPDKNHFNLIDMGGNYLRFGDWNDDRDWERMFNHPPKVTTGIAPVKTCPNCDGLVHAAVMTCPLNNEDGEPCLYQFVRQPTAEEVANQEMILVTKDIDLDALVKRNVNKYELYTFLELGELVVKEMYRTFPNPNMNIKLKYFKIYFELCKHWYHKTMSGINGNMPDISNSAWHIKRAQNNFYSLIEKHEANPAERQPRAVELSERNKLIKMEDYRKLYPR